MYLEHELRVNIKKYYGDIAPIELKIFRNPGDIVFGWGTLEYLKEMESISRSNKRSQEIHDKVLVLQFHILL